MAKFKRINKRRSSTFKVSTTKLFNKKTNKLVKRGKVKPKSNYQSVYHRRSRQNDLSKKGNDQFNSEQKTQEIENDIDVDDVIDMIDGDDVTFRQSKDSLTKLKSDVGEFAETTDEEDVEDYERFPRAGLFPECKLRHLLPLKGEHGIILQAITLQESSDNDEAYSRPIGVVEDSTPVEEAKEPTTLVKLYAKRQEKLAEIKNKIGTVCFSVVANPEENINKLKDVLALLDNREPGVFLRIRKMAAMSLLEVFRDIIPAYRIRLESESDKAKRVKKETKKLKEFEDSLLRYYKRFLISLEKMIEILKKQSQQSSDHKEKVQRNLASFAMTCFSELLLRHPHFNFRSNIIKVIVDAMLHKDVEISEQCCSTLNRLFKDDKVGEVSLEAAKQVKQLLKSRSYNVPARILSTFLLLNVKEGNIANGIKTKKDLKKIRQQIKKMSRKERKRNKKLVQLEKELLETEAEERTNKSVLLTPVLEGLSKFAHLINIEFFDDLILQLYRLIESGNLNTHEVLHCLNTVFTILSGQGSNLVIDHCGFYNQFYQILIELQTLTLSGDLETLLQCLDVMLTKRRKQNTLQRVLAFIKRLSTVSLQSTPNFALALLSVVRSHLQHHKQSRVLLDSEQIGSGEFLPELRDPEHCNAHMTSLWEMHYLVHHYHPVVEKFANHIVLGCPLQGQGQLQPELSQKSPQELYSLYDDSEEFKPPLQPSTFHKKQQRTKRLHDCILSSESVTSQANVYWFEIQHA